MTGDELIEALEAKGVDMRRARVVSVVMPELNGEGEWAVPAKETWKEYVLQKGDGTTEIRRGSTRYGEFREDPSLTLPMRWVEVRGWYMGPGGYKKSENFDGTLGVRRMRDQEEWLVEILDGDVSELAETLKELL
jgi:hypothetical protein